MAATSFDIQNLEWYRELDYFGAFTIQTLSNAVCLTLTTAVLTMMLWLCAMAIRLSC